jgi:hypothetical protein
MAGKNDRYVVRVEEGWAVKAAHAKRASAIEPTQAKAEARAKQIVENLGGGEVRIQRAHGPGFRDSDTVGGGNDPFPPRDRKH